MMNDEFPDKHEGFSNVAGIELDIEEDNLEDIPDSVIEGEEELSLEDLIRELEESTKEMRNVDYAEGTSSETKEEKTQ